MPAQASLSRHWQCKFSFCVISVNKFNVIFMHFLSLLSSFSLLELHLKAIGIKYSYNVCSYEIVCIGIRPGTGSYVTCRTRIHCIKVLKYERCIYKKFFQVIYSRRRTCDLLSETFIFSKTF